MIQNKYLLILIPLLLLVSISGEAQNNAIEGVVLNELTEEAIEGVNVISEKQTGTISDENGKFSITLEQGAQQLYFSRLGYETTTINITVPFTGDLRITLDPKDEIINAVVVTAGKYEQDIQDVTVSMEVIPPSRIINRNLHSVDELVNESSGISVIDGQANIRGGSGYSYGAGSRVLLLVDDVPMLTADAGDVKWNFLPAENLSQIEIIKGASSALYGSSAMNGIINFRTAYPGSEPSSSFSISSGFYDNPKRNEVKWWDDNKRFLSEVSGSHRQKYGQFDLVTGINYFKNDGYRLGEYQERIRANLNTRYRFKNVDGLSVGLNVNTMKREGATFFIWENDSNGIYIPLGGLESESTTISNYTLYRTSIDPFLDYNRKNDRHQLRTRFFRTNNENDTQQGSKGDTYYLSYSYQKKIKEKIVATGGITELYQEIRSDLYEDHIANNFAAFLQGEFDLGRLHLSLGARLENQRIDDLDYDPSVVFRTGLNYRIAEGTSVRASFGQAYRYPTIAEKFISTQVGDFAIYPNDTLDPESGWSGELGIRQYFKSRSVKGFIDIAGFWSEYEDMMEFTFGFYGPPAPPLFGAGFRSINIGNTKITGFEITSNIQGSINKFDWNVMAGYTFIDPISTDFDPTVDTLRNSANYNILKYRYEHLVKAAVNISYSALEFNVSARYNSFMENIDAVFESQISGVEDYRKRNDGGDIVYDSYLMLKTSEMMSISLIVKNIFNREYMGRPADVNPPRIFEFRVRIDV